MQNVQFWNTLPRRSAVLTGTIADQAALHGVLAEIEALGLELLEVHRISPR